MQCNAMYYRRYAEPVLCVRVRVYVSVRVGVPPRECVCIEEGKGARQARNSL